MNLAWKAAHDYHPDATEVDAPTPSMYLLDCIVTADGQSSVNIMYDEASNTFALTSEAHDKTAIADEAELETRRAALIGEVELKAMMALGACITVEEAAACWAALSSSVSQSARLRVKELGGDPDAVAERLDAFFLTHPEC